MNRVIGRRSGEDPFGGSTSSSFCNDNPAEVQSNLRKSPSSQKSLHERFARYWAGSTGSGRRSTHILRNTSSELLSDKAGTATAHG